MPTVQKFDIPDPQKNRDNIKKHRLSFKVAEQIWSRPILELLDDEHSDDETRYKAIGLLDSLVCVTVIYTMRGDEVRIISAWLATPQERRAYYEQI